MEEPSLDKSFTALAENPDVSLIVLSWDMLDVYMEIRVLWVFEQSDNTSNTISDLPVEP